MALSLKQKVLRIFTAIGFDPRVILSYRHIFLFYKHKKQWKSQGGTITASHKILTDLSDSAGISKGHYFHQDLLVANFIAQKNPKRHVDIASRVDGFVAHLAAFRAVEVIDIRNLPPSEHKNITFIQADLMNPQNIEKCESLSCLHAIEHFGLGRYSDPINVHGHIDGINNLISLLEKNGMLYISFPIGQADEVHFNAHRVFHPATILNIPSVKKELTLERFDYVDDDGALHLNSSIENSIGKTTYGCGIYSFVRN
ncbi:DUF268 domain-containing protein [Gammaproteobacteria bacterium]|jgi:hypothetical protein|nr:DUF268 domain-containing protein [Gammaproteobacteria bacterium]MDA9834661.1 DUF268 domain-containing protein [Gammaproteobacteria bacterium]MDC3372663.1 DUF268 domain-containing protein [Gammaproteobacteria bacterium]